MDYGVINELKGKSSNMVDYKAFLEHFTVTSDDAVKCITTICAELSQRRYTLDYHLLS
jgi:hypothetical protein